MRFRLGRARRARAAEAEVEAAPAGAARPAVAKPEPATHWQQPVRDPQSAPELSPGKLDKALKRLRDEIPASDEDGSR